MLAIDSDVTSDVIAQKVVNVVVLIRKLMQELEYKQLIRLRCLDFVRASCFGLLRCFEVRATTTCLGRSKT